jgi:hypothetical protein
LQDLERFRASDGERYEETVRSLGGTIERLTAVVAAELSHLDA